MCYYSSVIMKQKDHIILKIFRQLKEIGFSSVIITPWFSSKPEYQNNFFYRILIKLLTLFNIRFLFTHTQIVAIK